MTGWRGDPFLEALLTGEMSPALTSIGGSTAPSEGSPLRARGDTSTGGPLAAMSMFTDGRPSALAAGPFVFGLPSLARYVGGRRLGKALGAVLLLLALLAFPASAAAAHESPPMTEESALLAADRMFPGHACEGRVDVMVGPTTPRDGWVPDGEATGIEFWWNGTAWQFVRANCSITIRPGLEPQRRCRVIVHEVGHLASNAGHTNDGGIMDGGGSYAAVPGCQEVIVGHRLLLADAKMILRERIRPRADWMITCKRLAPRAAECAATRPGERRRYELREGDERVRAVRVRWRR